MAIELVESGSHRSGGNDDDEESSATLLSPEARLSSSEGLPPPKRADIRAYWLPRRLAVRAVHRGYAWQIACACSAIGTLMGSCRAVGLWALCKYYLHSAYIMTPAAIEALLDASFLVALCLAEPNSVPPKRRVDWIAPEYDEPDEEDNSVSVGTSSVDSGWGNNDNELSSRSTNPSTSSSSSSQSSNNSSSKSSGRGRMAGAMKNAAKRMDLYMTHVFKRTRLRRKERKAGRQGLNRLGIRMPKEYAQFVTPRRRGACAVGMLWALADGTLSVVRTYQRKVVSMCRASDSIVLHAFNSYKCFCYYYCCIVIPLTILTPHSTCTGPVSCMPPRWVVCCRSQCASP